MRSNKMYAVMMQCRTGTRYLYGEQWQDVLQTITVSGHGTELAALAEMGRLQPRGFNRERIRLWVAHWDKRFS
jgi:hypothetical protein